MFLNLKKQYYENHYTIQSNMQIQCNPCQITNGILLRSFNGPEPGGPESTGKKVKERKRLIFLGLCRKPTKPLAQGGSVHKGLRHPLDGVKAQSTFLRGS